MIKSDEYNKLKEQIKQEVFQELIEEIPERCKILYKEVEVEGLDKDKVYIFKIYFKDNVDVNTLNHICYCFKETISNLGIKAIIVPLREGGDICNVKIEGDSNAV